MRDHAVLALVQAAGGNNDHLALGFGEIAGLLHDQGDGRRVRLRRTSSNRIAASSTAGRKCMLEDRIKRSASAASRTIRPMARVLLRLYLRSDRPLGPGKITILESIRDGGSISEAARGMKMSYRSAWLLVDSMNSLFKKPVVNTTLGGRGGGAATLTDFGADVIHRYRAMERATRRAVAKDLAALERNVHSSPRRRRTKTPRQ
jgi:molybdate transport system regulatory protein